MRLKFTRFLIRILLRLLTRFEVHGMENIPGQLGSVNMSFTTLPGASVAASHSKAKVSKPSPARMAAASPNRL